MEPTMAAGDGEGVGKFGSSIGVDPGHVILAQEYITADRYYGWERCWKEGVTPWDLKQPVPILVHLNQEGALPKGRALVPACGMGYDVIELACPERYVIGLDISETAVKKATEVWNKQRLESNISGA